MAVGKAFLDEVEVKVFVASVNFVADNRVAKVSEVNPDLMFASGAEPNAQQREIAFFVCETTFDPKLSLCRSAVGSNAIFDRNRALFILAERRVYQFTLFAHMAVNDGQINFFDFAILPDSAQFTRRVVLFRDDYETAGFAIQSIDQMRPGALAQVKSNPAD